MKIKPVEKLQSDEEKNFTYIASLLCVGHKSIHTHLFQKNFWVGYDKATSIRNNLTAFDLLMKRNIRHKSLTGETLSTCMYDVDNNNLRKFIRNFLETKSDNLDKTLIEAGKEALLILIQKKEFQIPKQQKDVEAIVLVPSLLKYLKKNRRQL